MGRPGNHIPRSSGTVEKIKIQGTGATLRRILAELKPVYHHYGAALRGSSRETIEESPAARDGIDSDIFDASSRQFVLALIPRYGRNSQIALRRPRR